MTEARDIRQAAIHLFDTYTHGGMKRRHFLDRLAKLAGGIVAAQALLPWLENNYAKADLLPESDPRIVVKWANAYMNAAPIPVYMARPNDTAKYPPVIVIHENRGLNPHIRDVARRLAAEGFFALAPDLLGPLGGTPDDPDKAREMIGTLDPATVIAELNSITNLIALGFPKTTGKLGAMGFCWGGGMVNRLAIAEPNLKAGIAYYGQQPDAAEVGKIEAALLLHYAGLDDRINQGIAAYEAALKAAGKKYELYVYPDVNHAFNNDTNEARYNKAAADLAWQRSIAFLKRELA